jgi:hypothetical protein
MGEDMQFNLDVNLIKTFRDKINSTPVFYTWYEYEPKWNLICAVMDRIDHTISVLNNNKLMNSKDIAHDSIIALVYIDILVKSIKELMKNLVVKYPLSSDTTIFNKSGSGSGTDDKYFNYIRALAFAHPVNTTEHLDYKRKGETKYCPYIMDDKIFGKKGDINVRVYSSADNSFVMENFPVSQLVQYAKKRYELLNVLLDRVDGIIRDYITHLRSRKIIGSTPIEILKSVIGEAEYRKDEYLIGDFKNTYSILTTPLTNTKNDEAVGDFRLSIENSISELASAYQKVDSKEIENCAFFKVLDFSYHDELSGYSYAYSKVKDHLSPNNARRDTHFGFAMLNELREFTNQYVEIDDGMSLEEIQLLVDTAIYLFEKKYRSN